MSKYFNNMEIEIVAELGNGQSVIRLVTGMYYDSDEFEEYSEPIEQNIIVYNNQITDSVVKMDDIIKERDIIISEARKKANDIISSANRKTREEYLKLTQEIKELSKNKDDVNKENEYYQTALKLRNNDYKYVVYHNDILKFDDFKDKLKKDCDYEGMPKYEDLMLRISNNKITYNSGSYYNSQFVYLCESEDEAMMKIKDIFSDKKEINNIAIVKQYYKYNFDIPHLVDSINKTIKKHNEGINRNIESSKRNVESYSTQLFKAKV